MSIGLACAIIKNNTMNIEKIIHEVNKGLYWAKGLVIYLIVPYAKNHGRNKISDCEL